MKIQLNKIYVNRTRIYLARAMLSYFDKESLTKLQMTRPIMWGTYDLKYLQAKNYGQPGYRLFALVENKTRLQRQALTYLRQHEYYEDDYPMKLKDNTHVFIVFRIPKELHRSYNSFIEGKFSEMFTVEQLKKMGITEYENKVINPLYAVLTKKKQFVTIFKSKLQEHYEVNVSEEELQGSELDSFYVPPTYEAFNVDHHGPKLPPDYTGGT